MADRSTELTAATPAPPLAGCARRPVDIFDVALLDLDGVVYLGPEAIPHAAETLAAARAAGMRLAFVTNNAARPPDAVAGHLVDLGIPADVDEIVTSAQAAARHLAEQLPEGSAVLVVGTTGLERALAERGLRPVTSADEGPAAVVQGYSAQLSWPQLAEGAVAIRRGLPWVATNLDPTVPSPRGPLPGNGSLVAALRHATGVDPISTGKPNPAMHRESLLRTGANRPLVVGDRLDTDIEGADAVGCPSLLVLTGVTSPRDLLTATRPHRPTMIARDLRGLLTPHPQTVPGEAGFRCGAWEAVLDEEGRLWLSRSAADDGARDDGSRGDGADDGLDGLRALCRLAWQCADDGGAPIGDCAVAGDTAAEAVLADLGLVAR